MISYIVAGLMLGLSAGFSPGPLFALVINESLQRGLKAGLWVAFAPLFTDLPIIFFSTWILSRFSHQQSVLGFLSLAGGLYVAYLGLSSIRLQKFDIQPETAHHHSAFRGIVVNATNPHPYLFWIALGVPTVIKAYQSGPMAAVGFIGGFYLCLIGAKALIAILAFQGRRRLSSEWLLIINRIMGVLLLGFSIWLVADGIQRLS
jgi:threonine/homoserine/homoserine lactone efflux protein